MNFSQVIETCLDFAVANGGTIATYPVGNKKLQVHSRTTRTEILVDQTQSGQWDVVQLQNQSGDNHSRKETASNKENLVSHLSSLWND